MIEATKQVEREPAAGYDARLEDSDLCLGAGIAEVRRPPGRTEQETIQ